MDANADVIRRWNTKPLTEPRDSGEKDGQVFGRIAESDCADPRDDRAPQFRDRLARFLNSVLLE
jgi:hypothetical protein